jgi:hypothetical protein
MNVEVKNSMLPIFLNLDKLIIRKNKENFPSINHQFFSVSLHKKLYKVKVLEQSKRESTLMKDLILSALFLISSAVSSPLMQRLVMESQGRSHYFVGLESTFHRRMTPSLTILAADAVREGVLLLIAIHGKRVHRTG